MGLSLGGICAACKEIARKYAIDDAYTSTVRFRIEKPLVSSWFCQVLSGQVDLLLQPRAKFTAGLYQSRT